MLNEATADYEFKTDNNERQYALLNITLDADSFLEVQAESHSISQTLDYWISSATATYEPEVRGVTLGVRFDDGGPVPIIVSDKDEARLWKKDHFRLFLSHSSFQKSDVLRLETLLSHYHADAFVAHKDIKPSLQWQREIELALASCHAIAFLTTEDSQQSVWCNQEIGWGLGRGLIVQSVRFDCDPRGFAGNQQVLSAKWEDLNGLTTSLLEVFARSEKSQRALHEPMVSLLEKADSWAKAKFVARLIAGFDGLTLAQIQRLVEAEQKNNEVKQADGVHQIIEEVARRHGAVPYKLKPRYRASVPAAADDKYDPFTDS